MSCQGLVKLFAVASLLVTATAFGLWRTSGEWPSPWVIRAAISFLAVALILFLICDETRPRTVMRFLAALFSLMAVIAFAADFSHHGPDKVGFSATSLMMRWNELAPSTLNAAKTAAMRSAPMLWEPIITTLLGLPAFVIFGALAAFMGFASRPRREIRIFVN